MVVEALEYLKRELEKIANEATADCYNEYEQIAGWCAYLEVTTPFTNHFLSSSKSYLPSYFLHLHRKSSPLQ
jgi:Calcium binding